MERFEGEVLEYMDHLLKQQFWSSFWDQNTRRRYAEEVARNNIVEREVENYQKYNNLAWNNFKLGKKQKINIQRFLQKKIEFDQRIRIDCK